MGSDGQQSPVQNTYLDFNPHSPCGERPEYRNILGAFSIISIHTPRVGSDIRHTPLVFLRPISIHTPRVGSDHGSRFIAAIRQRFQSTLPVWGATIMMCPARFKPKNFNPHSPCGERRTETQTMYRIRRRFQSTLPVWGATHHNDFASDVVIISIHTPRVGSDLSSPQKMALKRLFQSTLPVWGATCNKSGDSRTMALISIHTPRVGSDLTCRA